MFRVAVEARMVTRSIPRRFSTEGSFRSAVVNTAAGRHVEQHVDERVVAPRQSGVDDRRADSRSELVVHRVPRGLAERVDQTADVAGQAGAGHRSEVLRRASNLARDSKLCDEHTHTHGRIKTKLGLGLQQWRRADLVWFGLSRV